MRSRCAWIFGSVLASCGSPQVPALHDALGTGPDATGLDVPPPPLPPSCMNLPESCGPAGASPCCASSLVVGGTFIRNYDVGSDHLFADMSNGPATVSTFRFDTYDVTVARFRAFFDAGLGTQQHPPATGAGSHTLNGASQQGGWDPSWNAMLPADSATLAKQLLRDPGYCSWTTTPDVHSESLPVDCVSWYVAFAFCAWDGGYLPTEAQWGYAALGGEEQRAYPWSTPPSSIEIDCTYANYAPGEACNGARVDRVGSQSPKGDARWGQTDLSGNVSNWTLDWASAAPPLPCSDCANLDNGTYPYRIIGGTGPANALGRPAPRNWQPPEAIDTSIGIRCAREP